MAGSTTLTTSAIALLIMGSAVRGLSLPLTESNVPIVKRATSGQATYYDAGLGSCGMTHTNSDWIVAMNLPQMNPSLCGQSIVITANGKTGTAMIADTCMGCQSGDLDMSRGLFTYFADEGAGRISISWDFAGSAAPTTTSVWQPPPTTSTYIPPPPPPAETTTQYVPPPAPTTTSTTYTPPPPPPTTSSTSTTSTTSSTAQYTPVTTSSTTTVTTTAAPNTTTGSVRPSSRVPVASGSALNVPASAGGNITVSNDDNSSSGSGNNSAGDDESAQTTDSASASASSATASGSTSQTGSDNIQALFDAVLALGAGAAKVLTS